MIKAYTVHGLTANLEQKTLDLSLAYIHKQKLDTTIGYDKYNAHIVSDLMDTRKQLHFMLLTTPQERKDRHCILYLSHIEIIKTTKNVLERLT